MRTKAEIEKERNRINDEIEEMEDQMSDIRTDIRIKERRLDELDKEEDECTVTESEAVGRIESLLSLSTLTGSERDSLEIMLNTGAHHLQRIREIEVSHFSEVLA